MPVLPAPLFCASSGMSLRDSSESPYAPQKAQISLFLLHHDQVSNSMPPRNQLPTPLTALSSWHVSSHWPLSEQSHTNIGLARGRYLFPGFPSGLASILCPAGILLSPPDSCHSLFRNCQGLPTAAQIKFRRGHSAPI